MRGSPLGLLTCATLFGGTFALTAAEEHDMQIKPNLLLLMMDQLRFDGFAAGSLPSHQPKTPSWTPNLDSIAAEGALFKNGYSSTPTCTPARAGLLTGRAPWYHGMLGYGNIAKVYPFEMTRGLQDAGYHTAVFGKDHFGFKGTGADFAPNQHGYQYFDLYEGLIFENDTYHQWFENKMGKIAESGWPTLDMNSWKGAPYVYNESLHPTAYVGRRATQYILGLDNSSEAPPWFLKISFHRPHSPYDPPKRVLDYVSAGSLPPIAISKDGWDDHFRGRKRDPPGCDPSKLDAWCGEMPVADVELARRAYRASIIFVDEQIGKILDALRGRQLLERTFIIFTADHGDGQGDHYHWRKGYPYEFSAHVPMLIRWPNSFQKAGVGRGHVFNDVVELRDVLPTMLEAANVKTPKIEGVSMLCLLEDPSGHSCPSGQWRRWIDLEHSTCYNQTNHWNALTDGSMKYVFNAFTATEQLFNLTNDPYELEEVSSHAEYQASLTLWRGRMVAQFENESRGTGWVQHGELVRRAKGQTYSPHYPGPSPSSPPPPAPSPPSLAQCGACTVCLNPTNHRCQTGTHGPKTKAACAGKGHIWCRPSIYKEYV